MPIHRIITAITLLITLAVADRASADAFDDVVVFRPAGSSWFLSHNRGGPGFYKSNTLGPAPVTSGPAQWGLAGDAPLVGDVNGDGFDDIVAVRDGGNFSWFAGHTLDNSGVGAIGSQSFPAADSVLGGFGTAAGSEGNFLADVNGDGFDDAVTVNAGFNWFSNPSDFFGLGAGPTSAGVQFGQAGDQPIIGDFNGDGDADLGVYRQVGGTIHIDLTAGGDLGAGDTANNGQIGGNVGDTVRVANLNGDALDDIVMIRQDGTGLIEWFGLINDGTGFAIEGDGDNDPDPVANPSGYHNFFNPGTTIAGFGLDGIDVPVIADINGDNMDDIGVYRDGTWFFTFTTAGGALGANAAGDEIFAFGIPGDIPLIGEFGSAPPVQSDFDNDGDVDGADFLTWQRGFLSGSTHAEGDADGDGDVDEVDLGIWQGEFGASSVVAASTSGTASVPEPSSLALVAFGLLAFTRITDRRRGQR